ncbi:Benzil reductase ((S)-benzoin forming) [Paraburkholderia caffeinitolerans]|uniref:Benzil reductase ((S)-benzoin forming) n=1 Tax=Paraburkholderia caffeinitolerans TaxID=1723730 RepID=A0A6J5GY62_9BURK|nr:SDR family NAD(P)-dependent oxidoreductase [Paraburkholderia caffeinitolerans]CAB3808381.1 Benzil reductase ((S)-benzoin forming) [Paraburkholderia caffeinitolerans]
MKEKPHLIIITGTSRGIGAAMTRELLQPGNRLVCVSRSRNADLEESAASSGMTVSWHQQDLSQSDAAAGWLRGVLDDMDAPLASATLILNAGIVEPIGPVTVLEESTLLPHLLTNLITPMTMTAAFIAATERFACLRKVLAISSGSGRNPFPNLSAYSVGKAGLDMFMRSVSSEYAQAPAERAVRAVALAPGAVDTGMHATLRNAKSHHMQRFRDRKDSGMLISSDNVARQIVDYLARPDFGSTVVDDIRNV